MSSIGDEANIAHIARHNVTPEEAEEVIKKFPIEIDYQIVDGEERTELLGMKNNFDSSVRYYSPIWQNTSCNCLSSESSFAVRLLQSGRISNMTKKRIIPKFASEAEEATWWFEHADDFADDILASIAGGTLVRGRTAQRFGLGPNLVEIEPKDAERAKEFAAKQGLEYDFYVQNLVHDALDQIAKAS